jgi:hypothetical protein
MRGNFGFITENGRGLQPRPVGAALPAAPRTQRDSEVLCLLMAGCAGPLVLRVARTSQAAEGPLTMPGLWQPPDG